MDLKDGRVVIKAREDLAPETVRRIRHLIRNNFYDNLTFHRVIDGFMAQGGCPYGTGQGSSGMQLPAEFSNELFVKGTVAMARGEDPDSASCQFFICLDRTEHLDNNYTIWGEVVEGMELVDNIKKGDPNNNGTVDDPDKIVKMSLAEATPIKIG